MVEERGFGPQVQTVLSQVRPDAQLLMVSATFPKAMSRIARRYLPRDAVHFAVGNDSRAAMAGDGVTVGPGSAPNSAAAASLVSEDIDDIFVVVRSEEERFSWLTGNLTAILGKGLTIIFGATRGGIAALANRLRGAGYAAACIHGETDMADRSQMMKMFRQGELQLLCATEVAARGLDVEGVMTVVNYEAANSYEQHVHRVGRTGRAGQKGTAYTLLSPSASKDASFARSAVAVMRRAQVAVPQTLLTVTSEQSGTSSRRGRGGFALRGRGGRGGRGGGGGLRGR